MKSIRIGNDIRIEWPIVLSGDVSKLQDLDLTVEVRPSAKVVDWHNYIEQPTLHRGKHSVMMNGGIAFRPDIGDGKEHCHPHRPKPAVPYVKLPYHIEDNTLIAMWTADRQFAVGDYDIILYAHKNEGGQAVCDQYRFVRLVAHSAQADAPDDSGIEAVIAMQPVTLKLAGLSAYEVAVVNGFQGTEEEWLQSLKQPAIDAAEQAKEDIEKYKTETKAELKADIEALGYYESNEEFIRVYTDAEGKFLWGIRVDGSIEWAKGVPAPVKEALKKLEAQLLEEGDKDILELKAYVDAKVTKLQGEIDTINEALKPLTDTFKYEENEEFANVVTDAEGKVLFGIRTDGTPYFPKNEMYKTGSNEEFAAVWLDAQDKVLFGVRHDGSFYVAKSDFLDKIAQIQKILDENEIGDNHLSELVGQLQEEVSGVKQDVEKLKPLSEMFSIISNDEWMHAVVDAEGKVLFAIRPDGTIYMPKQETYGIVSNQEFLAAWVDAEGKVLFGVKADGTFYAAKHNFNTGKDYDVQIEQINTTLTTMQGTLTSIQESVKNLQDTVDGHTGTISNLQEAVNGLQQGNEAMQMLSVIDDPEERTEITTDAEDRVLAYRNKAGIKHEEKLALHEVYDKDNNKLNLATKEDLENVTVDPSEINIADLEGVSNHNTPNLLIASDMQKTFNDGTNSFTPPNEGYEMSNPIECQAGDWFTRTGTATGMVVVTDENDKNGTRLFNADGTTLGSTFQIPTDMTWVRYIRMAAEVGGASDGSVVICKGKVAYTGDNRGDFLTVKKLRVSKENMPNDLLYVKSLNGEKYYQLYVDNDGILQIREVDLDTIPESEYPESWKKIIFSGDFTGYFDRMLLLNSMGLIELKPQGVAKIHEVKNNNVSWGEFSHYYNSSKQERYVAPHYVNPNDYTVAFTVYDENFNVIEENLGLNGNSGGLDQHDFIYIDDNHFLAYASSSKLVNVPGRDATDIINGPIINEVKKVNGEWKIIGQFRVVDYPQLCTDAYGELGTQVDSHTNTITLDHDGNLIINCRNWDTWIKVRRVEDPDGTVTLGSKTLDYDEAIIGRVGGRHNSGYIDTKRVLNDSFSFTDVPQSLTEVSDDEWEEWQWFHSHDVKYWGMKQIGDKQYPTYTLFDNNYWTQDKYTQGQYNSLNKNNNVNINPNGTGNYYLTSKDIDENYAKYQHSRVIQLSIDWENHKIMDYRVYYIPKMYSREQSGATMYDEGIISIAYSYASEFGLWDFTTGETEVSGHIYKGAKELFHGKYENNTNVYRSNTYNKK